MLPSAPKLLALAVVTLYSSGPVAIAADHEARPIYHSGPEADISSTVVVPAACDTIYVRGTAAWNPGEKLRSDYGDTESQAVATIKNMRAELKKLGLDLSNIVMLQSTLAPDPKHGNKIDFDGYQRAYRRYFGTAQQPHKPARATYASQLSIPQLLVEMQAVAASCPTRAGQGGARPKTSE